MLLTEDAAGTAASKTRKFIKRKFGNTIQLDDVAKDDSGKPILTARGDTQTILNYLERQVRDVFFHNDWSNIKFEPGIARIAFNDLEFQQANQDARGIEQLKSILKILCSAHADEYDADLNGLSYNELHNRFDTAVKQYSQNEYERINSAKYVKNTDYTIVHIPDFETAKKYYEYTNPNSRWCITHMKNMWDTYTANEYNKVYFVLKKGFEKLEPVQGENCPLDEYGLSMFCVIVTNVVNDLNRPSLCTCTCRWNHENGGSDSVMNIEQISQTIGKSFFTAFKPYTVDELHAKGKYTFEEIIKKYNKTGDINVFDEVCNDDEYAEDNTEKDRLCLVKLRNKYNFVNIDENILISDTWFDDAIEFGYNGYTNITLVMLNNKYNFIDRNCNFLFDTWFDNAQMFDIHGNALIRIRDKVNFINVNCSCLCDTWFDDANEFHENYARVENDGKFNFIDTHGKLISDTWFDDADACFANDCAKVVLNGKLNIIDTHGDYLSKNIWFDSIDMASGCYYTANGMFHSYAVRVQANGKWNYLNQDGSFLCDTWFDSASSFRNKFAVVCLNDKWNFVDINGKLLSDTWFDYIYTGFSNEYKCASVKYKGKRARVYADGRIVSVDFKESVTEHFNKYMQKHLI